MPLKARGRINVKLVLAGVVLLVILLVIGMRFTDTWPLGRVHRDPPDSFTIFYTCDTRGHIEPCGCASGMAGGISRRQTYLRQDCPADVLIVDAGDVTAGSRAWERLELSYILKGYQAMGYHAVNLGQRELSLGREGLEQLAAEYNRLVSANVLGLDGQPVCQSHIVTELSNGFRCGIIGVVAPPEDPQDIGVGLTVTDPSEALRKIIPELTNQVDYVVLLAFADEAQMKALAQQFFEIDVIIGGKVQKPNVDPILENRSAIVFNTDKGKAVGRLDIEPKPETPWTYQNRFATLEESMVRDPDIAALVEQYKLKLKDLDVRPVKDDTEGLSSITAMRSKTADRYVGSAGCKECHPVAYDIWLQSKHAHALDTLEQKGHQYNPRCLQCHTVGYMASDGYINQRLTAALANVSCEACHGRGHHHNQQMAQEPPPAKRILMKITSCETCHDQDNSPDFDKDKYWQEITHGKL